MFKNLEKAWNARTPVYLHNGTKQNFMFQFTLLALFLLGFYAKDKYDERRAEKKRELRHLRVV
jgi:hypothetical protein